MNGILKSLFTIFLLVSFFLLKAQNSGTLYDRNDDKMRGYPMIIAKHYPNSTNFALDPTNWQTLKDSCLNTVRLAWIGPWMEDRYGDVSWVSGFWDMDEVAEVIDSCVKIAIEKDMNIIINYHNVGEQSNFDGYVSNEDVNMQRLHEFWVKIAPRYKNNDLVYYELTNEPFFSTASDYISEPFKTNLLSLYDTVRVLSPDRHILMFTFHSMNYNFETVMNTYDPFIDWDHTTVAYHMYLTSSANSVVNLSQNHRVMCTEWNYPGPGYVEIVDGFEINGAALENIGHSWCDWHDWDDASFNNTFDLLYPDAKNNGYFWCGDSICENSVMNNEFDFGMNDWTIWSQAGTLSSANVINSNLSGSNAIYVEIENGGSEDWQIQLQHDVEIVDGETYYISFIAKADANREIAMAVQGSSVPFRMYNKQTVSLSTENKLFNLEFTADSTDSNAIFRLFLGNNTSNVWVDKVWFSSCEEELALDCFGESGGVAFFDSCGFCASGSTGIPPILNLDNCVTNISETNSISLQVYPNPANSTLYLEHDDVINYELFDVHGNLLLLDKKPSLSFSLDLSTFSSGIYFIKIYSKEYIYIKRILKK